jgi:hypothetical protein
MYIKKYQKIGRQDTNFLIILSSDDTNTKKINLIHKVITKVIWYRSKNNDYIKRQKISSRIGNWYY